jgi:vacuolar-type H+-ATPase subunit H
MGEEFMKTNDILEEMETLLLNASRVPFTNRRVIEEDDLLRLIDALHESLPLELMEAGRIVTERQRILDEAQKSAQEIVEQAKGYIIKLTDENVITKQAQEQAQEIMNHSRQSSEELKQDAVSYASDVFKHLECNLEKTLEIIRQSHAELHQNKTEK